MAFLRGHSVLYDMDNKQIGVSKAKNWNEVDEIIKETGYNTDYLMSSFGTIEGFAHLILILAVVAIAVIFAIYTYVNWRRNKLRYNDNKHNLLSDEQK